jgi:hypothetical protein
MNLWNYINTTIIVILTDKKLIRTICKNNLLKKTIIYSMQKSIQNKKKLNL